MPLWAQRCLVAMLGRVNSLCTERHSSVSRRGVAYAFSQFDSLFTYDWSQLNEHPEHTNSAVSNIELDEHPKHTDSSVSNIQLNEHPEHTNSGVSNIELNEHPEHTNPPISNIQLFNNSCGVFGFAFIACWCIICFASDSRVDSHSGHADTFCHSQLIRSTLVLSFSSSLNQQSRPINIGISNPGDRITVADNCRQSDFPSASHYLVSSIDLFFTSRHSRSKPV